MYVCILMCKVLHTISGPLSHYLKLLPTMNVLGIHHVYCMIYFLFFFSLVHLFLLFYFGIVTLEGYK